MHRLSRLLLAAALAFACLPANAQQGDPAFQCFPVTNAEAGMEALRVRGVNVQIIVGDAAQRFVAQINALEPVTDYKAEKVLVMISEEIGAIALISGDVVCGFRVSVPADVLKSWIKTARGIEA